MGITDSRKESLAQNEHKKNTNGQQKMEIDDENGVERRGKQQNEAS
jgi:hypothetical protein